MSYHFLLQGIFLTQGSNLLLFMSPAWACGFLTTSTTWEAHLEQMIAICKKVNFGNAVRLA